MDKREAIFVLTVTIFLVIFSFLASNLPDGLERVAEDKNFIERAVIIIKSPIPDYLFPGIDNERIATPIAGISGVVAVFILGWGLAKLLKKNR